MASHFTACWKIYFVTSSTLTNTWHGKPWAEKRKDGPLSNVSNEDCKEVCSLYCMSFPAQPSGEIACQEASRISILSSNAWRVDFHLFIRFKAEESSLSISLELLDKILLEETIFSNRASNSSWALHTWRVGSSIFIAGRTSVKAPVTVLLEALGTVNIPTFWFS